MEIIVAKSAGFCFGVKRAVETVYDKINENGRKIYTYGPIIHNKNVTGDLEEKGVSVIENFDNIIDGEVIIRSHGVPPEVYNTLEEKNIAYTDCTCPFVKKIHNIVKNCYEKENKSIIIVGNPVHPEVIGINGWCGNSAVIIETSEAAEEISLDKNKNYAMVVQTTFKSKIFNKITDILCREYNIDIYNTICHATSERQQEVTEIAEFADAMIILGDKSSSNTHKLYEISKKICKKTFLCERICDLELNNFKKNDKIGISAGASTPPAIIKEAINTMSEISFEEMLKDTMVTLHTGDIVKGKVISVNEAAVYVDLGYKSDGIITKSEFSDDPNVVLTEAVKPDDELEVFVIRVNDGEGNVQLSKKKVDANKSIAEFEEAFNNKTPLPGKITDVVKGGLMAVIKGTKVFVPSSQISNRYAEDLQSYKGKEFNFNIIEFDKSKRRIVAGRKELAQQEYEEKRSRVFSSINAGDKITGTVSRIVDFGAFVDLGGVDGLIHISEMSWGRIKKVSDVLSEGDSVEVTVLDVNVEKGKISLSLKDINSDPWKLAADKYSIGSIVEGKVVRMVPFGAFVELEDGVDGLVHISQISHKHVVKPEDVLSVGEQIKAKVTDLDLENKKISLSIKETEPKPESEPESESAPEASTEENTEE